MGTKRKLLSLLGKLVFVCRVVQPGRIFIRRLFTASTRVKLLYNRVKLNNESMKDVLWWLAFIKVWNHKSVFFEDHWTSARVLLFSTDASNLGMGAVFNTSWWSVPFNSAHLKFPIAWRELFAIVVACRVWGHLLASRRVLVDCDNLAMVHSVNKGTSKNPHIMALVRDLYFVCSFFSFDLRLRHLAGIHNIGPDLLSRLNLKKFHATFPLADKDPIHVQASYLDYKAKLI